MVLLLKILKQENLLFEICYFNFSIAWNLL